MFVPRIIVIDFFLLSLFIQTSNMFDSPMSNNVNHRNVDYEYFTIPDKRGLTIKDAVEKPGRAFQTLSMACYPYLVKCDSDEDELMGAKVRSLGPETFSWNDENGEYKMSGQVIAMNYKGYAMSEMAYRSICCFFNVEPRMAKRGNDFIYDWEVIFNNRFLPYGIVKDDLDDFCCNIDIPFKCPSEDMSENNRLFWAFFQFCCPVRIAMVEGNHRMSAACRSFYGMDLESEYSEFSSEHPLPHAMSTIANTTNLVVVHTPGLKDLTNDGLEILRWASLKLQEASGIVISGS